MENFSSRKELALKQLYRSYTPILPVLAYYIQMHIGSGDAKSKIKAMFFPPLLLKASETTDLPENLNLNKSTNNMPFLKKLKYLGALITPTLHGNTKIKA